MIPKGKFFSILTIFVACAVLAWSCAGSSSTASRDETAPKESGGAAAAILVVALAVVLAVLLLSPGGDATADNDKVQVAPRRPDVQPIRYTAIKVVINATWTYALKEDERDARGQAVKYILERLNVDGRSDGNTFTFPDGEAANITLDYTFNDVGQPGNERFTGQVVMSGWGWGYIRTFDNGQYPYTSPIKLVDMLTDQVYSYIHTGWHERTADER